jgi:hypothetical protein
MFALWSVFRIGRMLGRAGRNHPVNYVPRPPEYMKNQANPTDAAVILGIIAMAIVTAAMVLFIMWISHQGQCAPGCSFQ